MANPTVLFSMELVDGRTINTETAMFSGVYAHGLIENLLGNDLLFKQVDGKQFEKDGIYDITVRHTDFVDYSAKLYFWFSSERPNRFRGLVVFSRDKEATDFAMKHLNLKSDEF